MAYLCHPPLTPDETQSVRAILALHWGITAHEVTLLASRGRRRILRIDRPDAPPVVLRAYENPDGHQVSVAQAAMLDWLEQRGYPAPRLHPTIRGGETVDTGTWQWLVVDFIAGPQAGFTPGNFAALSRVLARLHALEMEAALPDSTFHPMLAGPAAARQLSGFAGISGERAHVASSFLASLATAPRFAQAPRSPVHTDAFPGNAVACADGQMLLIDWDDAGAGTAVLDLGYLLATCVADLPDGTAPPPERVVAIAEGYRSCRTTTISEMELLADAIAFVPAVYGAWHLAACLRGEAPDAAWRGWWNRHQAAEAIASLARPMLRSS